MYNNVYVLMHAKDPVLSAIKVGHCVLAADFYLSFYSCNVANGDIYMIESNEIRIAMVSMLPW